MEFKEIVADHLAKETDNEYRVYLEALREAMHGGNVELLALARNRFWEKYRRWTILAYLNQPEPDTWQPTSTSGSIPLPVPRPSEPTTGATTCGTTAATPDIRSTSPLISD